LGIAWRGGRGVALAGGQDTEAQQQKKQGHPYILHVISKKTLFDNFSFCQKKNINVSEAAFKGLGKNYKPLDNARCQPLACLLLIFVGPSARGADGYKLQQPA
jgi:hypothetical protein